MKILFVTVSLNTKYIKYSSERIKEYFPNDEHIIIDGSTNWPYPQFEWMKLTYSTEADYIILVDEDCFINGSSEIYKLLNYMSDNNISLSGPSDGFSKYRGANPTAMNSFFMVINRNDFNNLNLDISNIQFNLNDVSGWSNNLYNNYDKLSYNKEDYIFKHDDMEGGFNIEFEQEPYYFLFWEMIKKGYKFHYLYQSFDERFKSTNLRFNKESDDLCIHMWYLRQHNYTFDVWGLPNNKRYELIEQYLNKDRKVKIGLLIIATNKYTTFLDNLILSADKHFLKDKDVEYFIFSDKTPNIKSNRKINYIRVEHKDWPWMTLGRYKIFSDNASKFNECDYLYYTDVDMLFVGDVDSDILSDRVSTTHPGYLGGRGTPETNLFSLACVRSYEDMTYYAGGFNGGSREEYLKMSSTISKNIDIDYSNGIIAIWHDESHLNRYFVDNTPTKVLDPGYCYPEKSNLSFTKKLLALDKNHSEMRKI